jgi:hypothetical protein
MGGMCSKPRIKVVVVKCLRDLPPSIQQFQIVSSSDRLFSTGQNINMERILAHRRTYSFQYQNGEDVLAPLSDFNRDERSVRLQQNTKIGRVYGVAEPQSPQTDEGHFSLTDLSARSIQLLPQQQVSGGNVEVIEMVNFLNIIIQEALLPKNSKPTTLTGMAIKLNPNNQSDMRFITEQRARYVKMKIDKVKKRADVIVITQALDHLHGNLPRGQEDERSLLVSTLLGGYSLNSEA